MPGAVTAQISTGSIGKRVWPSRSPSRSGIRHDVVLSRSGDVHVYYVGDHF